MGSKKLSTIETASEITPEDYLVGVRDNGDGTYSNIKYPIPDIGISKQGGVAFVEATGVDSRGTIGNPLRPFATIDAALDAGAALSSLCIKLGMGTFAAPTASKMRSYLSITGSGVPGHNGTMADSAYGVFVNTAPTKLVGGTIIEGKVSALDKQFFEISNLGVDCGPDYVTAGGAESDCIGIGSATATHPFTRIQGVKCRNLILLGNTPTSLFHCLVAENTIGLVVDNVETFNNVHGIAVKSIGATITRVRCGAHGWDAIIIKSDDYANSYATILDNFIVYSVGAYDCAGVVIQAASEVNVGISVSNGVLYRVIFGIKADGGIVSGNLGMSISDVKVLYPQTIGIEVANGNRWVVNGCMVIGAIVQAYQTIGNVGYGIYQNCLAFDTTTGNGWEVSTIGRIDFENVVSIGNAGYGINLYDPTVIYIGSHTVYGNTVGDINGAFQERNPSVIDQSIQVSGAMPSDDNKYINTDDGYLYYKNGSTIYKVAIADSFMEVDFENVTNVFEPTPNVWANATGGPYGHLGLSNTLFTGDVRLIMSGASHSGFLGLNSANAQVNYVDMEVCIIMDTLAELNYQDGGVITATGITIASTDLVALYRSGSTFKVQRSVDNGDNWTDVATLAYSSAATHYIVCDIAGSDIDPPDGGRIINPILK